MRTNRQPGTPVNPITAKKRCAVYTRKSTDEGLDQEYNSPEAQRDAGSAYIASHRHEAWIAVNDGYDDGGYLGGDVDRPALKRLLADIEAGRVDIIVVYNDRPPDAQPARLRQAGGSLRPQRRLLRPRSRSS